MPQSLESLLVLPWMDTALGLALLAAFAWLAWPITYRVLRRVIRAVTRRTEWAWDTTLEKHGAFRRLAQMVPALVVQFGIDLVPGIGDRIELLIRNVALAATVLFGLLAVGAALNALEELYQASVRSRNRSIKGYIQLAKLLLFVIGAIVIIASLINRSPLLLLSGLGAVSAVLLLVFKDTILSLVASVQLASNDMLRVGDEIAMPAADVDGQVVDIALHTVKVVNWDKTISTVPTWQLIAQPFRNYRNMYQTGRRIRRALDIDVTSVHFHTPEEIDHLRRFRLLEPYFRRKDEELSEWNGQLGEEGWDEVNHRRLTNLGSFRAYMKAYVGSHPGINQDLFWAVRQLDPEPTGIPLQIYAYTRETGFVAHHGVQDDIFDHLVTILPEFGLRLFQQPSGSDLAGALRARGPLTEAQAPTDGRRGRTGASTPDSVDGVGE